MLDPGLLETSAVCLDDAAFCYLMTRQDAINTLTLWLIWWVFICHPEVKPDCVMCNDAQQ